MARKKKDNPLDYISMPDLDMDPEIKKNIWALVILALAIISLLGLIGNGGVVGEYSKEGLTWLFGWGRWLLPIIFLAWSGFIFFQEKLEIKALHYIGLVLLFISALSLSQLVVSAADWQYVLSAGQGGGHLGYWLAGLMVQGFGLVASYIISFFIGLISLMFIFNTTLFTILHHGSRPFRYALRPVKNALVGKKEEKSISSEDEGEEEEESDDNKEDEEESEEEESDDEESDDNDDEDNEEEGEAREVRLEVKQMALSQPPTIDEAVNIWTPTGININLPIALLENRVGKPKSGDVKEYSTKIQSTLATFGIPVEMSDISVGPTVTQYSLRPADGVKLSKITNLQNNLSMALAAHPLRIEAPIPGKPLVGIEVPNKVVATVGLREIIESEQFKAKGNKLTFALGKDVANKPWVATIDTMPHLLVAGQTGSGKSVMVNSIIISLLYHNNPDDLRMIMIDPKRVELTQYNVIPHLLTPVITDASKTVNALRWTINEMDRRLRLLERQGKKDIISFNLTAKQKLPYIVFIIDELADLMMLAGKEVEPGIVRIAQMARAVGIHLILATQRPSVNVITGLIKANMPARIAFAVASGIDSRTILDTTGAEKLIGRGDMLFSSSSMPTPKRIQGSFISEKEIKKIVSEIKRQSGEPLYVDGIIDKQKVSGSFSMGMGAASDSDGDDKLDEAREVIVNSGKASATMLQRHLGVGYARAAKILDILEEQGVIGPSQGSKPREVLITKEQLQSGMAMSGMPLHNPEESVAPAEFLDEVEEEEESEDEEESDDDHDNDEMELGQDGEPENDEEEESEDEEQDEEEENDEPSEDDLGDEEDSSEEDEENEEDEEEKSAPKASPKKRINSFEEMIDEDAELENEEPEFVEIKTKKVAGKPGTKKDDDDFDRFFSR